MKRLVYLVMSMVLLSSCEKEIDLKLKDKSGDIVIEGNITDLPGPYYVSVTRSVAFTETNEYPPVTGAEIIITDDFGQHDSLVYHANGLYKTNTLMGLYGHTYTLSVTVEGTTYTATCKMPQWVRLDSLKQDQIRFGTEVRYGVVPFYIDPPELGNYYRFIQFVNGRRDKGYYNFSDNTNNGMVNTRPLYASFEREEDEVKPGDKIELEMQCIDYAVYTYFNALAQIEGGGGTTTPANPPTNLSNGALGIFSAHTVQTGSIIIE